MNFDQEMKQKAFEIEEILKKYITEGRRFTKRL